MAQNYELIYPITASDIAGNSVCEVAAITVAPMQLNQNSEYFVNGLINFSAGNKFTVLRQISLLATKTSTINIVGYSNGVLTQETITLLADTILVSNNYFSSIISLSSIADVAGTLKVNSNYVDGFIGSVLTNALNIQGNNSAIYNEFPLSGNHPVSTCTLYAGNALSGNVIFEQMLLSLAELGSGDAGETAAYIPYTTSFNLLWCRLAMSTLTQPTQQVINIFQS